MGQDHNKDTCRRRRNQSDQHTGWGLLHSWDHRRVMSTSILALCYVRVRGEQQSVFHISHRKCVMKSTIAATVAAALIPAGESLVPAEHP